MTEPSQPTPPDDAPKPVATPSPAAAPAPAAEAEAPQAPRKKGGIGRVIKWGLLVLLLLIVVGAVVLYVNLNSIIKRTVETQGTASLGVPTHLGAASINLFGGDVSLSNFALGSPEGYGADRMMSLGGLDVNVKPTELMDKPIRIASIEVTDPKLVLEQKGLAFNIKQFIDQLPPTDPNSETVQMVIGSLRVAGTQVVLRPDVQALKGLPGGVGEQLDLKSEYTITIPDIELTDVGTAEGSQNGAAIKEVVTLLVNEMAAKAAQSEDLPPEVRQVLSGDLSQIADAVKAKVGAEVSKRVEDVKADVQQKVTEELGAAAGEVLKDPSKLKEDPAKAIEQGLGGLLNRRKPADGKQPATQPK
jgi:uncharacterized protein involved in outer membrane biogenesis